MSYSITARVFQTNTNAFFTVSEKTVWNFANGGKWSEVNGAHVLTMGGSGTSGTLRLASDSEAFLIALGFHNYKGWVDVVPNLTTSQTAVVLHPEYYKTGTAGTAQREKQLSSYTVTNSSGRSASVKCTGSGQAIGCDIVIG